MTQPRKKFLEELRQLSADPQVQLSCGAEGDPCPHRLWVQPQSVGLLCATRTVPFLLAFGSINHMVVNVMKQPATASILVIEDDPQQIRLYSKALRGYRLTCVANGTAALKFLQDNNHPDLIILDNVLSHGERGIDFLPRLKELIAHVPIIIISGTLDIQRQLQVLQGPRAAHYVIEKPVDLDELEEKVRIALAECGLGETVRALQSLERAEKIESNEPERRFTERLARQHDIVNRLRGAPDRPNVSQLSRDYGVSRKTILRDLHDLIQRGQLDAALYPEWASEPARD